MTSTKRDRKKIAETPDPEPLLTFAEAVKARQPAGGNAEAAHRTVTILHLANIAIRVGRKIQFDPVKEVIVGDEEAQPPRQSADARAVASVKSIPKRQAINSAMPSAKPNVAALVSQMPATDLEKDGKNGASKFTGPDPAAAGKIFAEILSGGRESIGELLGLVREAGDADFNNYKAGYLLHGLVIYCGHTGQEDARKLLAEVLSTELSSAKHSKPVKGFFIRELRLIGGTEVVKAIAGQLLDDELCGDATQALLTIRDGAAPHLRSALDKSKGRNRVTILQALRSLQDNESTAAFERALADDDPDVRQAAAWALAGLGQPGAVDVLIKFADGAEGSARIEATDACLRLAERLSDAGKAPEAARRIYTHLRDTRTDRSERHVREASERALGAVR